MIHGIKSILPNSAPQEWMDEYSLFPKSIQTMKDFYDYTDKKHGSKPYLGTFQSDGSIQWKTRHEVHLMALSVGTRLIELGLKMGDRIGIYAENQLEVAVFIEAAQYFGFVIVISFDSAIYSYPGFTYHDSECSAIYISKKKLDIAFKLQCEKLKSLQFLIVPEIPDTSPDSNLERLKDIRFVLFNELTNIIDNFAAPPEIKPDTLATICYSSGTGGTPKGINLSHRAILHGAYNIISSVHVTEDIIHVSFLPLAHILERITISVIMFRGGKIVFASNGITNFLQDTARAHGTAGPIIPIALEKMHDTIKSKVPSQFLNGLLKINKFFSYFGLRSRITDLLLFRKIQKVFGGNLEWYVVAGDVFSADVHEFLQTVLNIDIIVIYGLSECGGAVSIDNRRAIKPGTCGCLAPHFELKFAENNEILVRGTTMFSGYWRNPEVTAESFLPGGWFRTGDKGNVDKYGNLIVSGRAYNLFEFKPGAEVALPFLEFIYEKFDFIDNIYLEYFNDGCCFLAIIVISKSYLQEASSPQNPLDTDEQMLSYANSDLFRDWARRQLRKHARYWDLEGIPYIGEIRFITKSFTDDCSFGLLTPTGKKRPHKFHEYFGQEFNEMMKQVMKRREEQQVPAGVVEYAEETD